MKFMVTFKDPDTLDDAIKDAVTEEVENIGGLSKKEQTLLVEERAKRVAERVAKWFEFGEYLRVEVDLEADTCTVVES